MKFVNEQTEIGRVMSCMQATEPRASTNKEKGEELVFTANKPWRWISNKTARKKRKKKGFFGILSGFFSQKRRSARSAR